MKPSTIKTYLSLHLLFVLYSLTDLFGKAAAGYGFDDIRFYGFYCAILVVLALYALGWQQIIKRLPLTTAFSNKAVTIVWGLIWGVLFFQEEITFFKILGACVVIAGVVLYSRADASEAEARAEQERMQSAGGDDIRGAS